MKKLVTLKQISKELDISISTVSKAIRNHKEISLDTRKKVQAFAKLHNYRPNSIAVSLKNQRTKNIGVIIPEIVHHFFTTVIEGIEKVANSRGYNVIVCLSSESFEKEVVNMQTLVNGSIDGFLVSLSKGTQAKKDYHHLNEVMDQGMPLVMFDRVVDDIDCDKTIVDDTQAAFEAVSFLLETGCRKIALITTVDYVSVGKLRTEGYEKALQKQGIPIEPNLTIKIEDIENCEILINQLFDSQHFDGVFAVNEYFAVVAMKIAQKRGFKIPDDISFIGFTDGILSKCATPSLSSIAQHGTEMGEISAKMLIDRLEEKEDEFTHLTQIIKTTLVERESTKRLS
ncbi:LacI family DNA-binding transcriptional regulator [Maribacter arenosus]|uniref:LacI family DNA-binding transcriptional regulator n=1 Tax=Maribacter arenosus TaxID=1854708 RepID=A0ABR7VG50_9FLAO|nr:LacI family DNA-binding transcriptional regulator [Maribacter arenosus]MBD0851835.1 LacI family DNA-binding transcriptional regulator [Maribacter arenosus]